MKADHIARERLVALLNALTEDAGCTRAQLEERLRFYYRAAGTVNGSAAALDTRTGDGDDPLLNDIQTLRAFGLTVREHTGPDRTTVWSADAASLVMVPPDLSDAEREVLGVALRMFPDRAERDLFEDKLGVTNVDESGWSVTGLSAESWAAFYSSRASRNYVIFPFRPADSWEPVDVVGQPWAIVEVRGELELVVGVHSDDGVRPTLFPVVRVGDIRRASQKESGQKKLTGRWTIDDEAFVRALAEDEADSEVTVGRDADGERRQVVTHPPSSATSRALRYGVVADDPQQRARQISTLQAVLEAHR